MLGMGCIRVERVRNDDNGDVEAEVIRQALFAVNPDMPGAILNGRWGLEVQMGVDLGTQIKAFKTGIGFLGA